MRKISWRVVLLAFTYHDMVENKLVDSSIDWVRAMWIISTSAPCNDAS
jgi:hypothetical protein